MITTWHGAMHRLLDKDPAVFIRPLRTLGIPFADPVATALRPTDLTHTNLIATEGRREALLTVLNQRGIRVTAESSDRINACTDTAKLADRLIRALAATTAEDLFEED